MVPDQVTGLLRPSPPRFYTERLASEIPIVGRSLAELLSRVLDSGPDVDLPTEVTLADLREY